MPSNQPNASVYTLWGAAHSFYTGKIRSYLVKKGIAFREIYPSHPRFKSEIVPAVGHWVVPILETPDGTILQDTSEMIDYVEARSPEPLMIPVTPVQRAVASLLGAFGSEALLPAGMHYRWSYRAQQEDFLRAEFGRVNHSGADRVERRVAGAQLMDYFSGFLPVLGVTPESMPMIEAAYIELLDVLDAHLQHHPYLLGGRPSIAEAPLFAHLARDPVPAMGTSFRPAASAGFIRRWELSNISGAEARSNEPARPMGCGTSIKPRPTPAICKARRARNLQHCCSVPAVRS